MPNLGQFGHINNLSNTMSKRIKDTIHDEIEVSPLALKIIDTAEFKKLTRLKQLSLVSQVFPCANHTRAEHSLGVYHLAGIYLESLAKNSNIIVTNRCKELIKIAGLLHDIGHSMFSHLFDIELSTSFGLPHHEERGVTIFKSMVTKYQLLFDTQEVEFISAVIKGKPITDSGDGGDDSASNRWMYQIVNNLSFDLDVDKLDYLQRDHFNCFGIKSSIQVKRIFNHCKISEVTGDIIFHKKIYLQIHDIFMNRYRLHKEVYRHKTVIASEFLVLEYLKNLFLIPEIAKSWNILTDDVLSLASTLLSLNSVSTAVGYDAGDSVVSGKWQWLDDNRTILEKCAEIKRCIDERKLPKLVRSVSTDFINDKEVKELKELKTMGEKNVKLGFCSDNKINPLDRILFYDNEEKVRHIEPKEISKLLENVVHENVTFFYEL